MKVKIIYQKETGELSMGISIENMIEKKYPECQIEVIQELEEK